MINLHGWKGRGGENKKTVSLHEIEPTLSIPQMLTWMNYACLVRVKHVFYSQCHSLIYWYEPTAGRYEVTAILFQFIKSGMRSVR